jgi:hypothetical protein
VVPVKARPAKSPFESVAATLMRILLVWSGVRVYFS